VYAILIIVFAVVIAMASVWSPVFALVIAIPSFLLFLAYVGLSRRADEKVTAPTGKPATGEREAAGGIWGEKNT
jgi:hypothetical protein